MTAFVGEILKDVLFSFYEQFGAAFLTAILFMYLYLYVKKYGGRETLRIWFREFRREKEFRRVFLLTFYVMMILFKTLLCRTMWVNPLSDVLGTWGFYDANGALYVENIENFLLFLPFSMLFLWTFQERLFRGKKASAGGIIGRAVGIALAVSIFIEFTQLFLKLGTFQVSDLFFNTLGGAVGGFLYWGLCRLRKKH